MKLNSPLWFSIKKFSFSTEDAKHVWKTIHLSHNLNKKIKEVIAPVIERNAFFVHPENILAMIFDEQKKIHKLVLNEF
jgi:hypothetical protein